MKVINLFGGPGVGKSTTAAVLFAKMKMAGHNVELVTEYAKDMTWEKRSNILDDQLYILAKQNRRLDRLKNKVDYAITDSPLIAGLFYARPDYYKNFSPITLEVFNNYDNVSFMLERGNYTYDPIGRNQTEEEAILVDRKIHDILSLHNINATSVEVSPSSATDIYEMVVKN